MKPNQPGCNPSCCDGGGGGACHGCRKFCFELFAVSDVVPWFTYRAWVGGVYTCFQSNWTGLDVLEGVYHIDLDVMTPDATIGTTDYYYLELIGLDVSPSRPNTNIPFAFPYYCGFARLVLSIDDTTDPTGCFFNLDIEIWRASASGSGDSCATSGFAGYSKEKISIGNFTLPRCTAETLTRQSTCGGVEHCSGLGAGVFNWSVRINQC